MTDMNLGGTTVQLRQSYQLARDCATVNPKPEQGQPPLAAGLLTQQLCAITSSTRMMSCELRHCQV